MFSARPPWTSGYVQGIIDVPYLTLTPGTRLGVVHDAALARLADELAPLEKRLATIIEDQQRAEEERASRDVLRSVQSALKEALLALPAEEYDWFDLHRGEGRRRPRTAAESAPGEAAQADDQGGAIGESHDMESDEGQRQFFEYAGPLFSVLISPTSSVIEVGGSRALRASPAIGRGVSSSTVSYTPGRSSKAKETLDAAAGEIATFGAAAEPGLTRVEVTVAQGDVVCNGSADHRDGLVAVPCERRRFPLPGIAGLHLPQGGRGTVAFALRCRAQSRRDQQRPSRFRLCWRETGRSSRATSAASSPRSSC